MNYSENAETVQHGSGLPYRYHQFLKSCEKQQALITSRSHIY